MVKLIILENYEKINNFNWYNNNISRNNYICK